MNDVNDNVQYIPKTLCIIDEAEGVPEIAWFQLLKDMPVITIQPHPFITRISNEWGGMKTSILTSNSEDSDTPIIVEAK